LLNFVGYGSAFNSKQCNNSVYIKKNHHLIVIDCGGTVFHQLMNLKLLDDITKLDIIITHTHTDHIGSLGDLVFYSHFVLKIKPNIYFP
jgi:ribonuclease BN (tRNA processing enzyme)